MSNSITYASYLASNNDNPYHLNHIREFRELATMIAKEQIESYLPKIEAMVNNAINGALGGLLSGVPRAMDIDVRRIVDVTCKEMKAQFHSEELSHFFAETLKAKLEEELKKIDVKMIIT